MKRNFLTILLLAIAIIANADNRAMSLKNLIGGSSINGDYIDLNANTMLVDECHGGEMLLLYQQRNSEAMLYSSVEQGFRWKKDNQGGVFQVTRMGLLNSNNTDRNVKGNTGFFTTLDNLMGNHVWTRNILPVYVDDSANVVLGYRAKWNSFNGDLEFHNKNILYAYRLSDGSELWSDTISHYTRWGWNKVQYLPETGNYLVWADQLMLIDPQTGVVKRMTVNTGRYGVPVGLSKKDHSTNHNSDADYAFTPYVDRGYWTGIKSNIVFKDNLIYLADGEDLYCMDYDLNVKWFTQLPKDKTSSMHINIDGDHITLLSSGLAYLEGCSYEVGKPFVAQYDLATGKQYFLNYLKIEGKILDAYLGKDKAFYMTSAGLNVVSDFQNQQVNLYGKDVIGKSNELSHHEKYSVDGDKLMNFYCNGNEVVLNGKDGMSRLFDGNTGKVVKEVAENQLYDKGENGIYTCMSRNKKGEIDEENPSNLIIANDGNITAHFNTQFNGAFYSDGMLTIVMKTGIFSTRL